MNDFDADRMMRKLYERFKKGIGGENKVEFFEEDELLDIFDYAQDEGDVHVQLEALLVASRLFPNSDFMSERMACMVGQIDEKSALALDKAMKHSDSDLWQVLRFTFNIKNIEDLDDAFTELIGSDYRFSNESVIRLFDALSDCGRVDLIAFAVNGLREKVDSLPVLLFEAVEALYNDERFAAFARDMADELTRLEPFNVDYWTQLARSEYMIGHADSAINAAEYALALSPDNGHAILVRAIAQVTAASTRPEGIEALKSLLQKESDNTLVYRALAEAYLQDSNKDAALATYMEMARHTGMDDMLFTEIMLLEPSDPVAVMDAYYREHADDPDEEQWVIVATQLVAQQNVGLARQVMEYLRSRQALGFALDFYMRMLYDTGDYKAFVDVYIENSSLSPDGRGFINNFDMEMNLLLASSYLLLGEYDRALRIISDMRNSVDNPRLSLSERLQWKGMLTVIMVLEFLARNPQHIPQIQNFDPIAFALSAPVGEIVD